jgi:hypothetical protein
LATGLLLGILALASARARRWAMAVVLVAVVVGGSILVSRTYTERRSVAEPASSSNALNVKPAAVRDSLRRGASALGPLSASEARETAEASDLPPRPRLENPAGTATVEAESPLGAWSSHLPEWTQADRFVDDNGLERWVVSSEPCFTAEEAHASLDDALEKAMGEALVERIDPRAADLVHYPAAAIRAKWLVPDLHHYHVRPFEYAAKVAPQYDRLYTEFVQLQLNQELLSDARSRWQELETRSRLLQLGLGGGLALALLGLVLGYCRADRATRGFYSGRLQILALAGVLGAGAIALWLAQSFLWL